MKKKIYIYRFLNVFLSRNLLILVSIPMDFEILFFMYVMWSDQFNLLSIITPKNLVLLTHTKLFPHICTLSSGIVCLFWCDGTTYSEFS